MAVMTLHVSRPVPLYSNENSKGVLTGLFISGLFIIICLGAILIFIVKRKKKTRNQNDEICEAQLSPIWTTKCKNKVNGSFILADEGVYSKPYITSTPYRKEESYRCKVDVHDSSSSSQSNFNSSMSEDSTSANNLDRTQSIGDIVEGNFVSFS